MNKDTKDIINHTASTVLNIAQMAQSGMKYAQQGDVKDKEKIYKHAFLAGVGILSLLTMGVMGLMESCRNDNRVYIVSHIG